jgi:hypothetical protein
VEVTFASVPRQARVGPLRFSDASLGDDAGLYQNQRTRSCAGRCRDHDRSNAAQDRKIASRGVRNKRTIIALVERGGQVRSFSVPAAHLGEVVKIVRGNIAKETRLHTDESCLYTTVGREFAAHETVNHAAKEYARGDVTTNTVESYFSIFKRGMRGTYQHCAEKHLHLISRNLISAITIASRLDTTTKIARLQRSGVVRASASPIINLVRPDFSFIAARFLRWRSKRR